MLEETASKVDVSLCIATNYDAALGRQQVSPIPPYLTLATSCQL